MPEAASRFEENPTEEVAFEPLEIERILRERQLSEVLPGQWSLIVSPDQAVSDLRWFEYRATPNGGYIGSVRYSDKYGGWLAYRAQQGLINHTTGEGVNLRPIAYPTLAEAAQRIDGTQTNPESRYDKAEHRYRQPKLRLILGRALLLAIFRNHS